MPNDMPHVGPGLCTERWTQWSQSQNHIPALAEDSEVRGWWFNPWWSQKHLPTYHHPLRELRAFSLHFT